ncbi:olfactory receptor 1020-like [Gopherus flavomarginatus]|uniref:olfactory receptor 1020-like n=1 Tax=Gopherus flavomarginatus TaxID=286002 RepID=UPI0021CB9D7D|nr:olfactory receptor 1020-like [Gopherus flavomarginatus]
MALGNYTTVTGFILQGITENPKLQIILFMVFSFIYFCTLVGNLGMIVSIRVDPRLHTSTYFFLSSLSFLDIGYSSVIAPKTLVIFSTETKDIFFSGRVFLFFFLSLCANTELCLLAVMAYDRFVAICNPLLYHVVMSRRVCIQLVLGSYLYAFAIAITHTSSLFCLSFCHSHVLDHFFCDIPPLQKISCSNIRIDELVHFTFSAIATIVTIMIILVSYTCIIFAILRIRSAEGSHKAFNTCASHLTVVAMLYGTLFFMYLCPISSDLADQDKVLAVFYTLLNPLIYSLRKKEVKDALRRMIYQKIIPCYM